MHGESGNDVRAGNLAVRGERFTPPDLSRNFRAPISPPMKIRALLLSLALGIAAASAADTAMKKPPADQFRFGIAYGAGTDNRDPEVARKMGAIGVDLARGHVNWGRVQPKSDVWRWEEADAIIAAHEAAGIEVQLLLSGAPGWSWRPGYRVSEHVSGGGGIQTRIHLLGPNTPATRLPVLTLPSQ